jgi:hypothetical protein
MDRKKIKRLEAMVDAFKLVKSELKHGDRICIKLDYLSWDERLSYEIVENCKLVIRRSLGDNSHFGLDYEDWLREHGHRVPSATRMLKARHAWLDALIKRCEEEIRRERGARSYDAAS